MIIKFFAPIYVGKVSGDKDIFSYSPTVYTVGQQADTGGGGMCKKYTCRKHSRSAQISDAVGDIYIESISVKSLSNLPNLTRTIFAKEIRG